MTPAEYITYFMVMNYKQAVEYLYGLQFFGIKLGLDNIKRLCAHLGNPQEAFRSIHVAGTNGKGSVCAMLDSVLRASGYKTGLYTSPHLVDFRERTRVNGEKIPESAVMSFTESIRPVADEIKATFFEVTTAMAFWYFREQGAEFAVIETGMGGRLDATNALTPLVSVITPVSMDHRQYLGDMIEEIAREKAGIIKENETVTCADMEDAPLAVIREEAAKKNCRFVSVRDKVKVHDVMQTRTGYRFSMTDGCVKLRPELALPGAHQLRNAATTFAALQELRRRKINITDADICRGLSDVRFPGRFQIIPAAPPVVLDVAHNPEAAGVLIRTFQMFFPEQKPLFVLGMSKDKDLSGFIRILEQAGGRIILCRFSNARSAEIKTMEKCCSQPIVYRADTVREALDYARRKASEDEVVVVTGSFYTVGEYLVQVKSEK